MFWLGFFVLGRCYFQIKTCSRLTNVFGKASKQQQEPFILLAGSFLEKN